LSDPQVTVLEKECATQDVSVLDQVQKGGVYPVIGAYLQLEGKPLL